MWIIFLSQIFCIITETLYRTAPARTEFPTSGIQPCRAEGPADPAHGVPQGIAAMAVVAVPSPTPLVVTLKTPNQLLR